MEKTLTYKKRIKIFTAAVFILIQAVKLIVRALTVVDGSVEGEAMIQAQMISRIGSIGNTVITFLLISGAGYLLTKDKKKTAMYVGSAYFGISAGALFTKLVTEIGESLYNAPVSAAIVSNVTDIVNILLVAVSIFVTYFAFTALEGINTKFPAQSIKTSVMTVSRARKRYIVAYIVSGVVVGAVLSIHNLIFSLLYIDITSGVGQVFSVASNILSWLTAVASFAIMYYAGYKPAKSHVEAISFYSALALINPVTSILMGVLNTVVNIITNPYYMEMVAGDTRNAYTYSMILSIGNIVISVLGAVVEIALCLYALKLFFTKEPELAGVYETEADVEVEATVESEAAVEAETVIEAEETVGEQ